MGSSEKNEPADAKSLPLPSASYVRAAAIMKAHGSTWEEIAAKFGYASGDSARHVLKVQHHADFEAVFRPALEEWLEDTFTESILGGMEATRVLRADIRSTDPNIRQGAAKTLVIAASKRAVRRIQVEGSLGIRPDAPRKTPEEVLEEIRSAAAREAKERERARAERTAEPPLEPPQAAQDANG